VGRRGGEGGERIDATESVELYSLEYRRAVENEVEGTRNTEAFLYSFF